MAELRNGGMARGGTAEWQIVMDNGPSYSSRIELEKCGKSGELHVHPVQFWVLAL